jgi:hypothetical protein
VSFYTPGSALPRSLFFLCSQLDHFSLVRFLYAEMIAQTHAAIEEHASKLLNKVAVSGPRAAVSGPRAAVSGARQVEKAPQKHHLHGMIPDLSAFGTAATGATAGSISGATAKPGTGY